MPDEPPKRPAFVGDFRLGDWLVHPSLDRVTRGDTVVHLRRQLTDLLVLLARHPGETLPKERILEEVWGTQFVGESGLTRCVTELRQALHDEARAPWLIETIPKRGYRLLAPVEFLGLGHARPENGRHRDVADAAANPDFSVAAAPPDGPQEVDDGDARPVATPSRWEFIRQARWPMLKVAVVVGVAATVGAGNWTAPVVVAGRDTVLLADVVNTTGNRVFDEALRLALASNLEQAPFVRVLPRENMRAALVRMGRSPEEHVVGPLALEVCRREGAAALLAGTIAPLGSHYAVGLEALACGTGESVGRAIAEAADKEHVLSVLDRVATGIRFRLGESRASLQQHSIPLVRATTASLEALEALTLGDDSRDHARIGDALDFYRQATDLDPGFAVAWARRGAAAHTIGSLEESIAAFRRAYDLRDKVSQPERFYIEAHYHTFVTSDPQKAADVYRAWKRMYPGSLVPTTNLAVMLSDFMGQYDAALPEAREAVRLGPYSSIARGVLTLAYLGSGRMSEARQTVADAVKIGITDRVMNDYMLDLALFDGDTAAIEREVRRAAANPVTALRALQKRASAAMAAGRLREGRKLWAEAAARAADIGPERLVAESHLLWAESEALLGDARQARKGAEKAMTEDRSATTLADAAIVVALTGDAARARSILDSAFGQTALNPVTALAAVPVARALVESRLGHDDAAVALLQPAVRFENGRLCGPLALGARGLVALSGHRSSEAIGALANLLGRRVLYPVSPWVPYARLALARALLESGDTARSLAAYDDFLASWKDADGDAPLLNAVQRERAAVVAR